MKMKLRIITVLTLILALSMSALSCGKPQEHSDTSEESLAPDKDEKEELTVWAILSPEIDNYATNYQSQWYEEYSGIKVNWINVPMHGWADAFKLSVMNGEYPDVYLYDFDTSEVDICAEYGAVIPLNELIEENCPNIKKYLEERPKIEKAITAPDGNIYTLFAESYNVSAYTQKLWVNREWLAQYTEEAGKGMPETLDEFEEMLVYFKEHDMNGNGDTSDEIPYMGYSGVEGIYALMGAFIPSNSSGNAYGCIADNDGKCKFSYNTDEFRESLKYLNNLYEQGLISDQTFTINTNDRYYYTSMGRERSTVGVASAVNINEIVQLGSSEMDYTAYVAIPPLKGPEGIRSAVTAGEKTVTLRNAITSSCKNPAEAARWLDYWYSEEGRLWAVNGGLEGIHWRYEDGETMDGDGAVVVHADDVDVYDNFCWSGKGVAYMVDESDFAHMDVSSLGENASLATYLANREYSKYRVLSGWPSIFWVGDDLGDLSAEYSELENLIETYVTQHYTEFIMGKLDVENDVQWKNYVEGFSDLDLERYIELIELCISSKQ